MKTILIILAVILVLAVIAYFLIPKFRKLILGIAVSLGVIGTVVVDPEIPVDPMDDTIEVVDSVDVEEPEIPVIDSTEVEPSYTYKEITEVTEIPFKTFSTQIKSRSQKGEKGIREITYKLTFNKGQQIKKEKIKEKIKKHPKPQINYEPEITYKEITETESIPFTTSTTNVSEEARSGENGVLTITYKITYSDSEQIAKEKLSEVITRQPRSEIAYVEPEPEPVKNVYEITLEEGEDNTASLQDQLDAIPSGTKENPTIINLPKGRFNVEGTLVKKQRHATVILNKENIVINGKGTTFYVNAPSVPWGGEVNKGTYSHRRQFGIIDSKNITVNYLRIEGANTIPGELLGTSPEFTPYFWKGGPDTKGTDGFPAYISYWEQEHAIDIIGCEDVTLFKTESYGNFGDGIYIGDSRNTKLLEVLVDMSGRQGIATSNLDGLLIYKVTQKHARRSAVDLETDFPAQEIKNVEIAYSTFQSHLGAFTAGGPGMVNNVHIHHNKFIAGGNSVFCYSNGTRVRRENWTYEFNERIGGDGSKPTLKFGYTDNVIVRNNIDIAVGGIFVSNTKFQNMVVENNTINKPYVVRVADFKEGTLEVEDGIEILDNSHLIPEEDRIYKN